LEDEDACLSWEHLFEEPGHSSAWLFFRFMIIGMIVMPGRAFTFDCPE
jgi:hypothetical protein